MNKFLSSIAGRIVCVTLAAGITAFGVLAWTGPGTGDLWMRLGPFAETVCVVGMTFALVMAIELGTVPAVGVAVISPVLAVAYSTVLPFVPYAGRAVGFLLFLLAAILLVLPFTAQLTHAIMREHDRPVDHGHGMRPSHA